MSEQLTNDVSRARGNGTQDAEAFDAELDACLERALFSKPDPRNELDPAESGPLSALLDLASTEESWLQSLPPSANDDQEPAQTLSAEAANVVIPAWLRAEESSSSDTCGARTSWHGVPHPGYVSMPGSPAEAYAPQPWAPPAPELPEPAPAPVIADASPRILGMSPLSFISAVAMGALAAGLLVVAGLRLTATEPAPVAAAPVIPVTTAPSAHVLPSAQGQGATTAVAQAATGTQGAAVAQVATAVQDPPSVPGTTSVQGLPSVPGFLGPRGSAVPGAQSARVSTPSLLDAQRAAQSLTPGTRLSAGPTSAGLTTGLHTLTPNAPKAPVAEAPVTKKKARAQTLENPEDTGEVRELSFGGEISREELARARQAAAESEAEEAAPPESEIDEDFARELGFTDDKDTAAAKAEARAPEKTVYVPPAPTASEREHLSPSDVSSVVVAHQPDIAACVQRFKTGTSLEEGGRFQVRWSVDTAGTVSGVAMETDALKGSPLATCVEDQVRGWKFPVHRVALTTPVHFPFVI